jgi:Protein of unknown function (DUF2911)
MRQSGWTTLVLAAAVAFGASVSAQKTTPVHPGKGGSPHVKTVWVVDSANIAIEYGQPALKGRPEAELMPVGQPWRTGADEATVITTDKPLTFGSIKLDPGTYTINTEPGDKGWQLIFGKLGKPGQWGVPYNKALEIGRTPMALGKTNAAVEQMTIHIDDTPKGAVLRVEWGTKSASAPFTVAGT